jgi:YfiH family protein
MEWRESDGVHWLEADLPGATAAFTTRLGGVSEAPFDSLNLGLLTDDEPERVVENRRRLAASLGFAPERVAIGRQVHGAELAHHAGPQRPSFFARSGDGIPEVDGHVTAVSDLPLLVFAADCLPVALSGPGGVAILHCGWRGLASSTPPSSVRTCHRHAGTSANAGLVERGVRAVRATAAAIGPGIGPCCYEVAEDVLNALAEPPTGLKVEHGSTFRPVGRVDLTALACEQLRAAGVERIECADLCTSCNADLFFSHRRDAGRTGRQAGLVWLDGKRA